MVLLGFCDDVFDVKWRYKIFLPSLASIPMLMVYFISDGVTAVVIPYPFKKYLGNFVNLGALYYVYMAMMATFCTNAVNIVAGINGVEVGQTLVIAVSVIIFNFLHLDEIYDSLVARHLFSLYLLIPFVGVSIPLLLFNKYPAKVFVGDTYCYFGGMVLAVVGVLGHFSKTMLLFFGPQIFNFILSAPQLFKLIPCPRHRMPKLNSETGKLEPSETEFDKPLTSLQILILTILSKLNITKLTTDSTTGKILKSTNFTILNSLLVIFGPLREDELFAKMMQVQIGWSCISFGIRYFGAQLFYPPNK
jgi:UDP-N-acetylglucosamine--dolichyl-phosphate N-acetylglucosaminephosphotransferase